MPSNVTPFQGTGYSIKMRAAQHAAFLADRDKKLNALTKNTFLSIGKIAGYIVLTSLVLTALSSISPLLGTIALIGIAAAPVLYNAYQQRQALLIAPSRV